MAPVIGIDIGGTTTRIGLFAMPGERNFVPLATFPTEQNYLTELQQLVATVRSNTTTDCDGIGISVGAVIAKDSQSILSATNMPDYAGRRIAQDLHDASGFPVAMAHDPVCGLLAEKRYGAIAQVDRCGYVTVSTGIGGAIQLCHGAITQTISVQPGHQIVAGNQRHCLCGQIGCLETLIGGRQITLFEGRSPDQITEPEFWEDYSDSLAIGLINLAQMTQVEAIALSGGIIFQQPHLFSQVQERIQARIREIPLTINLATTGEAAPLIGASLLTITPVDSILH